MKQNHRVHLYVYGSHVEPAMRDVEQKPHAAEGGGPALGRRSHELLSTRTRLGLGISLDARHHTGFSHPGAGGPEGSFVYPSFTLAITHSQISLRPLLSFPLVKNSCHVLIREMFGTRDHRNFGLTGSVWFCFL